MGDRQSVEAHQWLAYIGRTRNIVTHDRNGRDVHLPRIPNVKVDGYCAACHCMPNRHKPIVNGEKTLL